MFPEKFASLACALLSHRDREVRNLAIQAIAILRAFFPKEMEELYPIPKE